MHVHTCAQCLEILPHGEFETLCGKNGRRHLAATCKRCVLKIKEANLQSELMSLRLSIRAIDTRREDYRRKVREEREKQAAMKLL